MKNVSLGDIIQVNPTNELFGACLAIISEINDWGVMAYVQVPKHGQAYVRLEWKDFELTGGEAQWLAN